MTNTDLKMEMLVKISTNSAQYFRGHLEDLDQDVAMITFPGCAQLEIGLKPVAT